jgi:hypothetical protein
VRWPCTHSSTRILVVDVRDKVRVLKFAVALLLKGSQPVVVGMVDSYCRYQYPEPWRNAAQETVDFQDAALHDD